MSEFNFGAFKEVKGTSNIKPLLKPWGIYPVKLTSVRKDTIKGKKDPNATYDVLKIRFDGEDGFYEETVFYPKAGDDQRAVREAADGHEYTLPSAFDRTMVLIAQLAEVFNPEGFKKMQEASPKFKSFDDVATAFITIMNPAIGKETNLKLTGRENEGRVVPQLPKFVAINKDGERFVSDNFVGKALFFSNYEKGKRDEYLNAKPTDMNKAVDGGSEDIDFESLLS